VLIGSADPADHRDPSARKTLHRSSKLRERIERSKSELKSDDNASFVWMPEIQRINNVVLKNARGHAFYELGERQETEPAHVWTKPVSGVRDVQSLNFAGTPPIDIAGWPEVGSRAFQRAIMGDEIHNGWVIVQNDVYRYQVVQDEGVYVRSVMAEYLAAEVYWPDY